MRVVYAKNEKAHLTAAEKKEFAALVKELGGAMAKKVKRRLADDIRASLHEALDHAAGKRTKVVVHRIIPRDTDAREARLKLGVRAKLAR